MSISQWRALNESSFSHIYTLRGFSFWARYCGTLSSLSKKKSSGSLFQWVHFQSTVKVRFTSHKLLSSFILHIHKKIVFFLVAKDFLFLHSMKKKTTTISSDEGVLMWIAKDRTKTMMKWIRLSSSEYGRYWRLKTILGPKHGKVQWE